MTRSVISRYRADSFWTLSHVTHMDSIQTNEKTTSGSTNKQTGRPWSVFVSVFHSVTAAEQQQGKQLICKHNRHNSVETFHKLGRIWLQRLWVALALTDCLCRRTSQVFSQFCLLSFKRRRFQPSTVICLRTDSNWADSSQKTTDTLCVSQNFSWLCCQILKVSRV